MTMCVTICFFRLKIVFFYFVVQIGTIRQFCDLDFNFLSELFFFI